MLIGLDQKGRWSGCAAPNSAHADAAPPASRRDLNHRCVPSAERGKPVVLLCRNRQEGKPQDNLTGQRVKEEGTSERRPVIGRIGVERVRHHPTRKGADFPLVWTHVRGQPTGVRQQCRNVGGTVTVLAGAAATTEAFREPALFA